MPNRLSSGLRSNAFTMRSTMGKKIAATACSLIQKLKNAANSKMALRNRTALVEKRFSVRQVRRVDKPQSTRTDDIMKAPRMKNTASLPNSEKASSAWSTPNIGNRMIASREVICSGIMLVTQSMTQSVKMPSARCALMLKPSGLGPKATRAAIRVMTTTTV